MADWCPCPEERNVIVGVAVSFVYAIDSFANGQSLSYHSYVDLSVVLIYPASEAPNYKVGYKAAAGFCVASLLATAAFKYKDRQLRQRQQNMSDMQEEPREEPATVDVEHEK